MCGVCGCGTREQGTAREHHHHHEHGDQAPTDLSGGALIEIERHILSKNDRFAEMNRQRLSKAQVLALNLVSSPGAGKTSLLVDTVRALPPSNWVGVIEGDQETANDAERIRETGVEAIQINTGRGCHLDAEMVGEVLDDLSLFRQGILFIENVGNLVCPAAFDLGEDAKVVILSVTEGDDKPLKYPDMFAAADLMILSKIDLLPHVDFDTEKAVERALRINPNLETLQVSVRTGEGMETWLDWVRRRAAAKNDEAASTDRDTAGRDAARA